jgi:Carboxypeptidase regulatory-like domain
MRFVAALLLLSLIPAARAQSSLSPSFALVRGQLQTAQAKGKVAPVPGVTVTLQSKSWSSPAVTSDKNGLYYIPNVAPGTYTLKVWITRKAPLTFTVTIRPGLTDLPPVMVPSLASH